jgi:hypothetical protein
MAHIKIKFSEIAKFELINKGRMTGAEVYQNYKPDIMINGTLYDTLTGTNITYIVDDGIPSGHLFTKEGFAVTENNDVLWLTKEPAADIPKIKDRFGFSPILIKDGVINIDWGNKYSEDIEDAAYRSIAGLSDTEIIFAVTDTQMSIGKAAEYALSLGIKNGGLLDGGGSCYLRNKERIIVNSTRANASWLMVWLKGGNMKTSQGLVEFAKMAHEQKWGYVWGTYGNILTDKLLASKLIQYPEAIGNYYTYIQQNYLFRRTVDCAGLIKAYLWWDGNNAIYDSKTDKSADMIYEQAETSGLAMTIPEIPGIAVWRKGHIGIYIGKSKVIEAKGTKYGIVISTLTGIGANGWTHWLKIPGISYEIVQDGKFSDITKERWSFDEIEAAAEAGFLVGFPDGTFKPTEPVTREQIAVIAMRIYNKLK